MPLLILYSVKSLIMYMKDYMRTLLLVCICLTGAVNATDLSLMAHIQQEESLLDDTDNEHSAESEEMLQCRPNRSKIVCNVKSCTTAVRDFVSMGTFLGSLIAFGYLCIPT